MVIFPQHPKRDQNLKFTPLSETTSTPTFFIFESPPRDKHQHLLYSSCHPQNTKKAIPFSLALRLRRICSSDETFINTRTARLATYLLKRGYKRNFVTKQIQRAADIPRSVALQTKDVNKPTRIPFITTFNPSISLPHICNIIKRHYNYCSLLTAANRFFFIYLLWPSDALLTSVIYLFTLFTFRFRSTCPYSFSWSN